MTTHTAAETEHLCNALEGTTKALEVVLQEQERLNKEYPRVSRTRALIGLESTREAAWSDAVRCIENWEGKSLPV